MRSFFKKLVSQPDNIHEVALYYTSLIGLCVTQSTLRKAIDEHPDYPSMLALHDAFSAFGAETLASRLIYEQLTEVDIPFVAQIWPTSTHQDLFAVAGERAGEKDFALSGFGHRPPCWRIGQYHRTPSRLVEPCSHTLRVLLPLLPMACRPAMVRALPVGARDISRPSLVGAGKWNSIYEPIRFLGRRNLAPIDMLLGALRFDECSGASTQKSQRRQETPNRIGAHQAQSPNFQCITGKAEKNHGKYPRTGNHIGQSRGYAKNHQGLQAQGHKIKAMREWCDKEEIHYTPTFFVNGHQLSDLYTVKDLKYLLKV